MTGLIFTPKTATDAADFGDAIENSDFYAEYDDFNNRFIFEEDNPESLEVEIETICTQYGIEGYIELVFDEAVVL